MDRIVGGAYSMENDEVGGGPVGGRVVGGAKQKLGRMLGKMTDEDMAMLHNVVKMSDQELEGSGFYSAMGRSFVDRIRPLLGETGTTHPVVQGTGKAGEAEMNVVEMVGDGVTGGVKVGGVKVGGRKISDKMKKRSELVKKLMKEKKLSLAEASKYIKEHNLM